MVIAGLGWLTFLFPPLAKSLAPFNMMPGAVGELSLTLWLLVKGVNVQRWNEQANEHHLFVGEAVSFPGKATPSPAVPTHT
jgi:hypothetical protein